MQNKFKKITLDEIYRILKWMSADDIQIKYPIEIKQLSNGLGIKMVSSKESIVMCMYPDHATSQVSITRKGMRYLIPKRDVRIKKCTFEDMMHTFMSDDRLFGVTKIIELYFIEVIKLEHAEVIESVYLS